jgi:hypothetical protein
MRHKKNDLMFLVQTMSQLVPVPRFAASELNDVIPYLKCGGCTQEQASELTKRLPSALDGRKEIVYVSITENKHRILGPPAKDYLLIWLKGATTQFSSDIARVALYALLLDGFIYELNTPKHRLGIDYFCETPLTSTVYSWDVGAHLLLDLPREYGLDVNVSVHYSKMTCKRRCDQRYYKYGVMNALKWCIRKPDKNEQLDLKLYEKILIKSSDAALNDTVSMSSGSEEVRPIATLLYSIAVGWHSCMTLDLFLSFAYEDGSGILLSSVSDDFFLHLNFLNDARHHQELQNAQQKIAVIVQKRLEYRTNLPMQLQSACDGLIQPLISIIVQYVVSGSL